VKQRKEPDFRGVKIRCRLIDLEGMKKKVGACRGRKFKRHDKVSPEAASLEGKRGNQGSHSRVGGAPDEKPSAQVPFRVDERTARGPKVGEARKSLVKVLQPVSKKGNANMK